MVGTSPATDAAVRPDYSARNPRTKMGPDRAMRNPALYHPVNPEWGPGWIVRFLANPAEKGVSAEGSYGSE
jgi:hypothetical protein